MPKIWIKLKKFYFYICITIFCATICVVSNGIRNVNTTLLQTHNSQIVEKGTFAKPTKKNHSRSLNDSFCTTEQTVDVDKFSFIMGSFLFDIFTANNNKNIFTERFSLRTMFLSKIFISHIPNYEVLRN